ncbi:M35 family metallo-endopeptidase [Myxococcus sp. NMCA1]|uniref:M35 family metallo-endopeptidase n=1 Tax=Myxococcus sp. NMCA1 TaxID=2996785 RepID=UPI003FA58000
MVHELTHKLQATEDLRYDYQELAPSAAFPVLSAISSADSWAYFCGDVLEAVSKSTVKEAPQCQLGIAVQRAREGRLKTEQDRNRPRLLPRT